MVPAFRRIITKRAEDGRSVLAEDIAVTINEIGLADFWSTSTMPARCDEFYAFDTAPARLEPPSCGTIFRYFAIPPQGDISTESYKQSVKAIFAAMQASHCQVDTRRHPAMHTTRTIDYVVLLRGQVSLLLDEGDEIPVRPLDVVIQRGTNHYWINRGSEPALLMGVLLDAVF
ncbi:MAG TPA: cupin domain-containing protein [Xanthobacteraceae bacterium]|jgi:hypothetical protein